jgi:streptomycin 6-kinase
VGESQESRTSYTRIVDLERERRAWQARRPAIVDELSERWRLRVGPAFGHDGVNAWVAPVRTDEGCEAVLKIGWPHPEAVHEIAGLRWWSGEPTVRLLEADEAHHALLLERCRPGHDLRRLPAEDQDVVLTGLLHRLWRPAPATGFQPLAAMLASWTRGWSEADVATEEPAAIPVARAAREAALQLIDDLARPGAHDVLLATDLHAGNVLAAEREPWLVIDPKPFVGDPAYDVVQHLLNHRDRLASDPERLVTRFAASLDVDADRVRAWLFVRLVIEASWGDAGAIELARRVDRRVMNPRWS